MSTGQAKGTTPNQQKTKTETTTSSSNIPLVKSKSVDKQLTISLVVVCISYLLLTTPFYLYFYLATLLYFEATEKRYMDMHMIFAWNALILITTNSAINFFIYLLFGKKFRKDLLNFFGKIICRK